MPGLIADGWLIGMISARAMTDGTGAGTDGWQPGDTGAAAEQLNAAGLGSQLTAAQANAGTLAQQVADGYRTRLGRVLAEGAAAGATAAAIGASLTAALTAAAYATASALAQLATAIGRAAQAVYGSRGVAQENLITMGDAHVDAECLALADANPHPAGTLAVPVHFGCRCGIGPA